MFDLPAKACSNSSTSHHLKGLKRLAIRPFGHYPFSLQLCRVNYPVFSTTRQSHGAIALLDLVRRFAGVATDAPGETVALNVGGSEWLSSYIINGYWVFLKFNGAQCAQTIYYQRSRHLQP